MRKLVLFILAFICCGCARKPLVITVPDEDASASPQNVHTLNSAISILRQLENNPDDISIVIQKPASKQEETDNSF